MRLALYPSACLSLAGEGLLPSWEHLTPGLECTTHPTLSGLPFSPGTQTVSSSESFGSRAPARRQRTNPDKRMGQARERKLVRPISCVSDSLEGQPPGPPSRNTYFWISCCTTPSGKVIVGAGSDDGI